MPLKYQLALYGYFFTLALVFGIVAHYMGYTSIYSNILGLIGSALVFFYTLPASDITKNGNETYITENSENEKILNKLKLFQVTFKGRVGVSYIAFSFLLNIIVSVQALNHG